jgi:hypothetical protein
MSKMQQFLCANRNEQFTLIDVISAQILSRLRGPDAGRHGLDTTNAQDLCLDTIVDAVVQYAPLCISALLVKLKDSHHELYKPKPGFSKGLNNDERFVLRNFLQSSSVERNVTLELFRQRSGLDEKSFVAKYGRDIDGSYNNPKKCCGCEKIQEKRLCPFQDKPSDKRSAVPGMRQAVDIEDCYKPIPSPSSACIALYNKRHGSRTKLYNPRSYFLDARAQPLRVQQPEPAAPASLMPRTAERKARIQAVSKGELPRQQPRSIT